MCRYVDKNTYNSILQNRVVKVYVCIFQFTRIYIKNVYLPMQIYIYIHIYMCIYIYICVYTCIYTHMYIYRYSYKSIVQNRMVWTNLFAFLYMYTYIYMYILYIYNGREGAG